MFVIGLLEDEAIHRALFTEALERYPQPRKDMFCLLTFENPEQLFQQFESCHLIYIDIGLGDEKGKPEDEIDGLAVGKKLRQLGCQVPFIIITSYENKHKEAIEIGVLRYLQKPYTQERFDEALYAALQLLKARRQVIQVTFMRETYVVSTHEIVFIENYQKKRRINLISGEIIETTTDWEDIIRQMPAHMFGFVQKSYLISFNNLRCVKSNQITMKNGREFKISRTKKQAFKEAYDQFIMKQMW